MSENGEYQFKFLINMLKQIKDLDMWHCAMTCCDLGIGQGLEDLMIYDLDLCQHQCRCDGAE